MKKGSHSKKRKSEMKHLQEWLIEPLVILWSSYGKFFLVIFMVISLLLCVSWMTTDIIKKFLVTITPALSPVQEVKYNIVPSAPVVRSAEPTVAFIQISSPATCDIMTS